MFVKVYFFFAAYAMIMAFIQLCIRVTSDRGGQFIAVWNSFGILAVFFGSTLINQNRRLQALELEITQLREKRPADQASLQ